MITRFRDERFRRVCEERRRAVRELGKHVADKLRARLADLDAVGNVTELPAGRPHELHGDRKGQYAVVLHRGIRLVFEPTQQPPPDSAHGGIEWRAVDDITIVFIGDYHD